MTADQIIKYLEEWAPPEAAWENDNVGLQVGAKKREIKNIFLSLELTQTALNEAIKQHCNFIFTHHPLIFKPLKNLNFQKDPKAKLIEQIIKNDIALYSAHTNLDFTKNGVSYQLAKVLGLKNIMFLENQGSNQYKLSVFVPENYSAVVSEAVFNAGGGIIGEYKDCSFSLSGKGTFKGSKFSNPAIGKKRKFETISEERIDFLVNKWDINKVISAMLNAHPYEEPAYDVYVLKNKNANFGTGAIGHLENNLTVKEFLNLVSNKLKVNGLRYCKGKSRKIKKVAVCGGSCASLLHSAVNQNADAFITADIKYHDFQDAENKILFIDAGHYETELPILDVVKDKLEKFLQSRNSKINIIKFKGSTNPIKFLIKKE